MKIVIDIQGCQGDSKTRGIGRYSLSFALSMAKNATNHEIWLLLNSSLSESISEIRNSFKELIPKNRIQVFKVPGNIAYRENFESDLYKAAEVLREDFILQLKPDFLIVSSLFEGFVDDSIVSIAKYSKDINTAVILYDLIPFIDQKNYLQDEIYKTFYLEKINQLKKANLLLSISNSSKQEAISALQIEENVIKNISTAVDERFCKKDISNEELELIKKRYKISKDFIMYTPGGFDIRKNFDNLFKAFSLLSSDIKNRYQLVIVGRIHDDYNEMLLKLIKKYKLKHDDIIITGYVSDQDLIYLYNITTLFVYPSVHEGFGLPVLEAMSCGTAVIGSNKTSVPEVIGLEEALFDPLKCEEIAQQIEYCLTNEDFLNLLREHSLKQCKEFSWDITAKKAIEYLESSFEETKLLDENDKKDVIEKVVEISSNYKDVDIIRIADAITFNSLNKDTQLLVDISVIVHGDAKSGIQRVVRSILSELLKNDNYLEKNIRPIYFDDKDNIYRYANNFLSSFLEFETDKIDSPVQFNRNDTYLALDLNAHLTKAVHDLHKTLKGYGVNMCYIVYDILLVKHPEWWPEGTSQIFEEWLYSVTEVGDTLICISQAVADDVAGWIEEYQTKRLGEVNIKSFHMGADIDNSVPTTGMPENASETLSFLNERNTFLMVGTLEPRKGHIQTLKAFEQLWLEGYDVNFVIVGKRGWLVEELLEKLDSHIELGKRLFFLESISDEYLENIYKSSACLIFSSEGEGFGLPLIEAAQHKIPIIARNIPIFKEISKDFAYYFSDTKDAVTIVEAIKNWLELYKNDEHPKSSEMPWLTWKESTKNLLNLIKEG